MIRSSKVYFRSNLNERKSGRLDAFLKEYRRVAQLYLDEIWDNGVTYNDRKFCVGENKLDVPQFLSKESSPLVETVLSARACKCCLTQVLGIISVVVEKKRRALWIKAKREIDGQKIYPSLERDLLRTYSKPSLSNLKPELASICADFQETDGKFNGFLALKSIGKSFGKISIPINYHRQLLKWNHGKLKGSFLISDKYAVFRYEIAKGKKLVGELVGADTGLKTVVTLSNGEVTPKTDSHGHSLESIVDKIARKKKGSGAFLKASEHRKNFIHWSVNKLNLRGLRQINLEKVVDINFGRRASRKMQAWTNTVIRDKVLRLAEEQEVLVVLRDSAYMSQRCSSCGLVRKSNRKGEVYSCACGNVMNADLNAAKNHELDLPRIPFGFLRGKRAKGFVWSLGTEFAVPTSN
jgi:transposase